MGFGSRGPKTRGWCWRGGSVQGEGSGGLVGAVLRGCLVEVPPWKGVRRRWVGVWGPGASGYGLGWLVSAGGCAALDERPAGLIFLRMCC